MPTRSEGLDAFRRRLVGLYALTLMERDGSLHGYGLSERISRRTDGAWRPGPGSVYPSLQKLVDLGYARARKSGRRREYVITRPGRALLGRIRQRSGLTDRLQPDLSPLWAEVLGTADVGDLLLQRLRRTLDSLEGQLRHGKPDEAGPARLRRAVLATLDEASARLGPPLAPRAPARREVAPRAR